MRKKYKKVNMKKWGNRESYTLWQGACILAEIEPPKTQEAFEVLLKENKKVKAIFEKMVASVESGELKTVSDFSA